MFSLNIKVWFGELSATDILERVSWSNASTLNRKGGIGSSIIKGPRLYNTVFDLTEILWNKILELQKGARHPYFNFYFRKTIKVKF